MPRLNELDPVLQAAIDNVKGLRPRRVIEHILAHGQVTTEDLQRMGYEHPPRAARDVRECGVPLVTTRVLGTHGKKIEAYTFGDPRNVEYKKLGGRRVLPKELRNALFVAQAGHCATCNHQYDVRYLQVDHRVPYEVAGEEAAPEEVARFMLLCGSCQRKKSWSCEHCENWSAKKPAICASCFWAGPTGCRHIAGEQIRSLTMTFSGADASAFDELREQVGGDVQRLADHGRALLLRRAP